MADRRVTSTLYPGRDPVDTDPFAVPVGPEYQRLTGQKTLPKGQRRALNVRISRAPTISTYRPNTLQRVSNALRTVGTGGVGQALDVGEAVTGVGGLYASLERGARQVVHGDAYRDNPDLQKEDAINVAINALFAGATPAWRAARGIPVVDSAVNSAVNYIRRIPGVDSAVNRAVNYFREVPGGRLVDPDYIEGAFSVRPPNAAKLAVPRLTGPAPDVAALKAVMQRTPEGVDFAVTPLARSAPADLAAKPARGLAVARAPRSTRRAPAATPKAPRVTGKTVAATFDNVTDYNTAMGIARRGEHLKQAKSGQYLGAPRDTTGTGENLTVNSPASLAVMRENLDQKAQEGLFNADWYDRARQSGADLSGFDLADYSPQNLNTPEADMASLFARGTAAYSPQYTPLSEVNAFAKQHNAKVILGQNAVPKTRSQAANVNNAYTLDNLTGKYDIDPTVINLGKKTGPYADAKDPTINPQDLYKTANDLWHGRVVGYSQPDNKAFNRAFTPPEHGFLIGENLLAADRANMAGLPPPGYAPGGYEWTPRSVQAATWGAQRVESANAKQAAAVAQFETDNAAYAQDLADWTSAGKPKGQKPKKPKAPTIRSPKEIETYARYGIDNAVKENLASLTAEYMPGFKVNQARELFQNNDLANQFSDVMAQATGTYEPTLRALQTYSLPIEEIPGGYMNSEKVFETNKAYNAPLLGSTYNPLRQDIEFGPYKPGVGGKPGVGEGKVGPQMDEATKSALDLAAILNATRNAQEGTGANMFIPKRGTHRPSQLNAAQLEGPRGSLEKAIASMRGVPGLDVVDMGDVARITQFPGNDIPLSPVEIQNAIEGVSLPPGVNATTGRLDSTSYWPGWGEEGSGQMTERMLSDIDALNIPNVYDRLNSPEFVDPVRRENMARDAFFAKYGLSSRPDIQKFNELLGQEGPKSLRDYIAKYGPKGLPVVLGGMTLPYVASEYQQQY